MSSRMLILCATVGACAASASGQPICLSSHINNQSPIFSSFGDSVAIDGDTVVVGAPSAGPARANVYEYSEADGWSLAQSLVQPDGLPSDKFGQIIAIENDVLAVASSNWDEDASHTRSIYLFRRIKGLWTFEQKLFLSLEGGPCSTCLGFAKSIVIDDGRIAVGAAGGTTLTGFFARVHIYQHDGDSWIETHIINMDEVNSGLFNAPGRLALRGALLVGGAPGDDSACLNDPEWQKKGNSCSACNSGAMYILRYDASIDEWIQEAKIMPDDLLCQHGFGSPVALDGERIIARRFWPPAGRVYVYEYDADSAQWIEQAQIPGPTVVGLTNFGRSIDLRGDTALVGGTTSGGPNAGFAFVYQRTVAGQWMKREVLTPNPAFCCSGYGWSVSLTDDWAIVGAPTEGGGGAAYIYNMQPPAGDITCDGVVGVADLLELLAAWGPCPPPGSGTTGCPADLTSDGAVGVADLLILLANWG